VLDEAAAPVGACGVDALAAAVGDLDEPDKPGEVVIWDLAGRKTTRKLTGHKGSVYAVAYSPDGARLASGSDDSTVKLWDLTAAESKTLLRGHAMKVRGVAFSPDGHTLASASQDQTVKLWGVASGDLALLAVFKYANFIAANLDIVLAALGWGSIALAAIPLPLGISFFTFHSISYVVDVYRKNASPQRRVDSFGLYILLFPQLIAGPIIRYKDIVAQLSARTVTVAFAVYVWPPCTCLAPNETGPGAALSGILICTVKFPTRSAWVETLTSMTL